MHDAVTGLVSGVTCFPKNSVKIAQAKDAHLRDMDQLEVVEDLANRVGLLYRQAGSPESAAQLLVRAAKLLEVKDPAQAVNLY